MQNNFLKGKHKVSASKIPLNSTTRPKKKRTRYVVNIQFYWSVRSSSFRIHIASCLLLRSSVSWNVSRNSLKSPLHCGFTLCHIYYSQYACTPPPKLHILLSCLLSQWNMLRKRIQWREFSELSGKALEILSGSATVISTSCIIRIVKPF